MSLPLSFKLLDPKRLRSFVTRQGRLTLAQRKAIERFWPTLGLDPRQPLVFPTQYARYVLEIGFGNGRSLAQMAAADPNCLFIGIEVHQPGVGALLLEVERLGLTNVLIYYADARDVLEQAIPNVALDRIQLFFPDPWPKNRHHKRRIVQHDFIALLSKKLKPQGQLHMATDWQSYAQHMLEFLNQSHELANVYPQQDFAPRPDYRPLTKFEQKGLTKGHGVWDLIFFRTSDSTQSEK